MGTYEDILYAFLTGAMVLVAVAGCLLFVWGLRCDGLGYVRERLVEGASLTEGAVMQYSWTESRPQHPLVGRVVTWKDWRSETDDDGNFVKDVLVEHNGVVIDVRVDPSPNEHRRYEGWWVLIEEHESGRIIERLAEGLILSQRPRVIPKDAIRV